jgi:hypothetical protein
MCPSAARRSIIRLHAIHPAQPQLEKLRALTSEGIDFKGSRRADMKRMASQLRRTPGYLSMVWQCIMHFPHRQFELKHRTCPANSRSFGFGDQTVSGAAVGEGLQKLERNFHLTECRAL